MVPPRATLGFPVFFARMLQTAREAGMDVTSLRKLHGAEHWKERCRIWDQIMRTVRVDGFPIRVAQRYSFGESGPLGLLGRVAPDLRWAFQQIIDYQRVWMEMPFG